MKSLERRDAVVMTGDDVEEQIDLDTTRQDMPQDTPQDYFFLGRECERLFLRLRRNNARHEKKIKDARKSGASGSALPTPYRWAQLLTFLLPFVKKRR